ncbi:MAG: hypothetical protein Q9184_001632 [Pyrenodesmia sp. 2 TL-2023]
MLVNVNTREFATPISAPSTVTLVGGHEGARVVVARGQLVKDVEIGDHAGIKLNGFCLSCDFYQQADEPLCPKALLSGYTINGTFQQYATGRAAHVARIPKEVPLDTVAPVPSAGITVYKGLKESGVRPGQTVAIVGAGGRLGSLACQYAKAMGPRIIAIDAGEEKENVAKELAAYLFCDFAKSQDLVKDVQMAAQMQVAEHVRLRGTVIAIGLPAGAFLKAPVFETVIGMKTIKGS